MSKPAVSPENPPKEKGTLYYCGTLVYTRGGLFILFTWLLLGDFCFTLMEAVWPSIVPLVLKAHEAPNFVIALVMATIPGAMNLVLNPIISTASDRFRSKMGRRIPFLLFSAPFISLFLILLGFAEQIGHWLYKFISHWHSDLTASMVIIALICVFIVFFRLFELFVSTVFYYLFNDVVPEQFMGRFIGFFKVVGTLAGVIFNFFIFKYATSHTSVIFLGAAILYLVAFILMGLHVKEGEYPPPDKILDKKRRFSLKPVITFFQEGFSARIFRLMYLYTGLQTLAGATGIFFIFMILSLGITLDQVGKINGTIGLVSAALMFPMGMLVDKFHPLRIMIVAQGAFVLSSLLKCVFLFYDFTPGTAYWIYLGLTVFYMPFAAANAMAGLPMLMRLFPHEKFGQLCATYAMVGALVGLFTTALGGLFLDGMRRLFINHGDFYYRFIPAWSFVFGIPMLGASLLVYREWKRLGGDNYHSPVEDKFANFHTQPSSSESETPSS